MFENEFKGKVVVITGGSRGIGFAAVKGFLANGAKVCFLSHYEETGAKALAALKEINPDYEVMTKAIDLCDFKAAQELYKEVVAKWGRIDVLINNAGTDCPTWLTKLKQSEWDAVCNLNQKAVFNMSKYAIDYLKKTKGCIINTASVAGIYSSPAGMPYPATKAAVIAMTKSMAYSFAPNGVRVNCIAPGVIDTAMMAEHSDETRAALAEETPLGRLGTPQDVARAAAFLLGDGAAFITGQVLGVDGGYL